MLATDSPLGWTAPSFQQIMCWLLQADQHVEGLSSRPPSKVVLK